MVVKKLASCNISCCSLLCNVYLHLYCIEQRDVPLFLSHPLFNYLLSFCFHFLFLYFGIIFIHFIYMVGCDNCRSQNRYALLTGKCNKFSNFNSTFYITSFCSSFSKVERTVAALLEHLTSFCHL